MSNNRFAFRHVIKACEGTLGGVGDEGYRALFGWRPGNGKVFTSFADHPRTYFDYTDLSGKTIKTSAAGAYQATATTWDDFIRERGPHDFTPASQDEFADWLVEKCGATADVDAGRLQQAIDKCGGRWASLPSSTVPQPRRTYEFCVAAFLSAGGTLAGTATQPAAPIEDRSTTYPTEETMGAIALPLLAQLLPQILGLFSQRAQATIAEKTGADPKLAADFMQNLIAQIGTATGITVTNDTTATQAVAALTSLPADQKAAKVQALEPKALATLDDLLRAGDKSSEWDAKRWAAKLVGRKGASEVAIEEHKAGLWDMTRTVVWFAAVTLTLLVGALLAALIYQAVTGTHTIDSGLLGLAGPIFMAAVAAWAAIISYRFDGTKESSEQTKALNKALDNGGRP